jgi:hypothetical protein
VPRSPRGLSADVAALLVAVALSDLFASTPTSGHTRRSARTGVSPHRLRRSGRTGLVLGPAPRQTNRSEDRSVRLARTWRWPGSGLPEDHRAKGRQEPHHFDVASPDPAAEQERVEALGGRLLQQYAAGGFPVMADPEGNEFCIIPEGLLELDDDGRASCLNDGSISPRLSRACLLPRPRPKRDSNSVARPGVCCALPGRRAPCSTRCIPRGCLTAPTDRRPSGPVAIVLRFQPLSGPNGLDCCGTHFWPDTAPSR